MARYARGDDAAFGEVYDGLSARLYRYLHRLTKNPSTAEDLLQQTFLRMHHARARFHEGADVVPWAYSIARRAFLDHARRDKRWVPAGDLDQEGSGAPPSPLPDAEAILSALELSGLVEQELREMPPVLREAFLLVREEELSMAQAAESVGVSVAAMKVRAHRAYERLRETLGEAGAKRARHGEGPR